MMHSSNPVFRRSEGFNGRPPTDPYGNQQRAASGVTYPAYGTPQAGAPTDGWANDPYAPTQVEQGRMTIDSVVQKTAITLGVVVVAASLTWLLTGDITSSDPAQTEQTLGLLYTLSIVGALAGFALSMVNSFKRVISPPLVLAYAVMQGIAVGAFSKVVESFFGTGEDGYPGLVIGAVVGTVAAVVGTLAAYKFFDIKVGNKFRTWVVAAMFGFVALSLMDLMLGMFASNLGINGFGPMGLLFSVIGLALGVFMLILDFDFVERGIEAGLPERESWRAAFGLTVAIVWIYIELLRILAILRGGE
jgi:uncharacterized YccA/Bax inhibitor family protein